LISPGAAGGGAAVGRTTVVVSERRNFHSKPNPSRIEAKPRRKPLDSLGFIRANRDFSMGYGNSKS
jgi:hypothetical protein